MLTSELDFDLPADAVAQEPCTRRDGSRLLVLNREAGSIDHRVFSDLPDILDPGDILVLNDTKVEPLRLIGKKETGGRAEILLLRPGRGDEWEAMTRGVRSGRVLFPGTAFEARVRSGVGKIRYVRFNGDPREIMDAVGRTPLPPYIRREDTPADRVRYQTVYARRPGAVAAPTAGLHFTETLLRDLDRRGVIITSITLHVGPGTFQPITAGRVAEHPMSAEEYIVPTGAAETLIRGRAAGRRIIGVGTTVTRTLETAVRAEGGLRAGEGRSELFIYPGFRFEVLGGLITNFHLPRSTPLFLAAAFAGVPLLRKAYREAIESGYRFYSYGDAMVIL